MPIKSPTRLYDNIESELLREEFVTSAESPAEAFVKRMQQQHRRLSCVQIFGQCYDHRTTTSLRVPPASPTPGAAANALATQASHRCP